MVRYGLSYQVKKLIMIMGKSLRSKMNKFRKKMMIRRIVRLIKMSSGKMKLIVAYQLISMKIKNRRN